MKKSALIIGFVLISVAGFSQDNLKGPIAKNTPIERRDLSFNPIMINESVHLPKGPTVKNRKVWTLKRSMKPVLNSDTTNAILKGPQAKNRKVWKD
jgi:hypothetical protein